MCGIQTLLESKQGSLLKSSKSKQQLPIAYIMPCEKSKQNGHCKQEIWKFPSTEQTKNSCCLTER